MPALAFFSIFFLFPAGKAVYYSFTQWDGLTQPTWIGLDNYYRAFSDSVFLHSFVNTFLYIGGTLIAEVLFGLSMAILLNKEWRFFGTFRVLFFSPMVISMVAVGVLWGLMYDYNLGLINSFLRSIGLAGWTRAWLGEKSTALMSITVVSGWRYAGFYMIIFYAALKRIPRQLYEAADIDGANGLQKIFRITLPLLADNINIAILLCVTGGFKAFALFYTMTNGQPNHATEIVTTWIIKQAFDFDNMGYGSALTVIMTIVVMILATIQIIYSRRRKTTEY